MKSTDQTATRVNVGPNASLFTLSSGLASRGLRQKPSFLDQRINKAIFTRTTNPAVMVTPKSGWQGTPIGFQKVSESNKITVLPTQFISNVQNKGVDLKLGNSLPTQLSQVPPNSNYIDDKHSCVVQRSQIGHLTDESAKVKHIHHQSQYAQSHRQESLKENFEGSRSQASAAHSTSYRNSILQTAKTNSIQNSEAEKQFTIQHFNDGENAGRQMIKPYLGRFNLSESLNPLKGFEKIFDWMRKVPLVFLPLFAMPNAAMAYGTPPGEIPPGFEDFTPIHQSDFVQDLITLNKQGICFFQEQLMHLGLHGSSAGLSIIIWAACLKVLTTPMYENSLKYPTQMEKAVQDVIEAQLMRNNPDNYTYESGQTQTVEQDPQMWTNPIKAQLAPIIYKFGVLLPLFYVEAQSLIQLIQEKPEFSQSFLWIPYLNGPSQEFGISWLQNHTLAENAPYLFLPAMIAGQMYINHMVNKNYSLPEDPEDEDKKIPIDFDLALPFLVGGAALATPAAVSVNFLIAQQLAVLQFFIMREKLKKFDGLDIEQIRQKDLELKTKMQNGETMQSPNLIFDFDQDNGNIKVNEEPVILKNETQKAFMEHYNNK